MTVAGDADIRCRLLRGIEFLKCGANLASGYEYSYTTVAGRNSGARRSQCRCSDVNFIVCGANNLYNTEVAASPVLSRINNHFRDAESRAK